MRRVAKELAGLKRHSMRHVRPLHLLHAPGLALRLPRSLRCVQRGESLLRTQKRRGSVILTHLSQSHAVAHESAYLQYLLSLGQHLLRRSLRISPSFSLRGAGFERGGMYALGQPLRLVLMIQHVHAPNCRPATLLSHRAAHHARQVQLHDEAVSGHQKEPRRWSEWRRKRTLIRKDLRQLGWDQIDQGRPRDQPGCVDESTFGRLAKAPHRLGSERWLQRHRRQAEPRIANLSFNVSGYARAHLRDLTAIVMNCVTTRVRAGAISCRRFDPRC